MGPPLTCFLHLGIMHCLKVGPKKLYSVTDLKKKKAETKFSCEKDANSHQSNCLTSLQISDGVLLWLKSIKETCLELQQRVRNILTPPTRNIEYLLASCLFIITKNEDVRWTGWGTWALPCPLLFYFLCRKEVGLLVSLIVFWTCVWFRQSPRLCHWWS